MNKIDEINEMVLQIRQQMKVVNECISNLSDEKFETKKEQDYLEILLENVEKCHTRIQMAKIFVLHHSTRASYNSEMNKQEH